jgi:hypothetical protein
MSDKEYRRLTRSRVRRKGFFAATATRSSLWLGNDHLLSIDSTRFTEEYKRFYFRDIQAITIRITNRRKIWNLVLMLSLLFWLGSLVRMLSELDTGTIVFMGITFLILALPLLLNNILGPTCTAYLRSAVQIEELPSLSRVLRAHNVLDRIRPLIVAAQGQLTPEELSARMQEMNPSSEPSAAEADPLSYA